MPEYRDINIRLLGHIRTLDSKIDGLKDDIIDMEEEVYSANAKLRDITCIECDGPLGEDYVECTNCDSKYCIRYCKYREKGSIDICDHCAAECKYCLKSSLDGESGELQCKCGTYVCYDYFMERDKRSECSRFETCWDSDADPICKECCKECPQCNRLKPIQYFKDCSQCGKQLCGIAESTSSNRSCEYKYTCNNCDRLLCPDCIQVGTNVCYFNKSDRAKRWNVWESSLSNNFCDNNKVILCKDCLRHHEPGLFWIVPCKKYKLCTSSSCKEHVVCLECVTRRKYISDSSSSSSSSS